MRNFNIAFENVPGQRLHRVRKVRAEYCLIDIIMLRSRETSLKISKDQDAINLEKASGFSFNKVALVFLDIQELLKR